jgi:hypothetical protein
VTDTAPPYELGLLVEDLFADLRANLAEICKHKGLRECFSDGPTPPGIRTAFHKFTTEVMADADIAAEKTGWGHVTTSPTSALRRILLHKGDRASVQILSTVQLGEGCATFCACMRPKH